MSAAQLELAAEILGPVLPDVVFVGGATVHLWVTEPAAPPTRATDDVDVIAEVASRAAYYRLSDRLRGRGLSEEADQPVICRWRHRRTELVIDVMPVAEEVLGFSNPWYPTAVDTAETITLGSDATIRAAAPAALVATKLSAWGGRGKGDILRSLDVHDVLTLIDGRPGLHEELQAATPALRAFVKDELAALRTLPSFDYAVEGATAGYGLVAQDRAALVIERVDAILSAEQASERS
ncbi:MAG: hypothetical protein LC808_15920 [Actinobacteria bacterium]|nr:hypothetical protein [Actinomycetota bacterium]